MEDRDRGGARPYASCAGQRRVAYQHLAADRGHCMPPVTRQNSNPSAAVDPAMETEVFWMKYRAPIIIGVIAVLVGAALWGAYILYTNRRDDAAAAQLARANDVAAYQKVISDYSNAPAAASAYIFVANEQRKAQKFADANATLQKFISTYPKHELIATAQMAMAGNLESLGKADEALEMYRRVAAEHPHDFNAPLALLGEVPLLKQKGQIDQARQVCETIMTQYRDSEAVNEASRYLRTLKAPAPATPPAAAPSVAPAQPNPPAAPAPTP